MAYTGTGTQEDPYIVDNWEDFLALCGTSGAYIAFDPDAENKVIDLNETSDRNGISRQISLYATVDGNGWIIRNMVYRSGYIVGNNESIISNLHFHNFISYCSDKLFSKVNFTECSFSGMLLGTNCFSTQTGTAATVLRRCAFNLHFMGQTGTVFSRYTTLYNCNIVLNGTAESLSVASSYAGSALKGCRISGKLTLNGGTLSFGTSSENQNSAVMLEVDGTGTVSASSAAALACIVDADLLADTLTQNITGTNWHALTTAQMQDPDYLVNTIGFPCAEVV